MGHPSIRAALHKLLLYQPGACFDKLCEQGTLQLLKQIRWHVQCRENTEDVLHPRKCR